MEMGLLRKTDLALSWDNSDRWNKFLVSNPTTAVGGMDLA